MSRKENKKSTRKAERDEVIEVEVDEIDDEEFMVDEENDEVGVEEGEEAEVIDQEHSVISVDGEDYINVVEHRSRMRLLLIAALMVFLIGFVFFVQTTMIAKDDIPKIPTQADLNLDYTVSLQSSTNAYEPVDGAVTLEGAVREGLNNAEEFYGASISQTEVDEKVSNSVSAVLVIEYKTPKNINGIDVETCIIPFGSEISPDGFLLVKTVGSTEYRVFYGEDFKAANLIPYFVY